MTLVGSLLCSRRAGQAHGLCTLAGETGPAQDEFLQRGVRLVDREVAVRASSKYSALPPDVPQFMMQLSDSEFARSFLLLADVPGACPQLMAKWFSMIVEGRFCSGL